MTTGKFRESKTSSGKVILLGRNAENNEELISQAGQNEVILHTAKPGSPFCNIKADEKDVMKGDIYEAAVFCARYSQDWRDNHQDVEVHVFLGKDIYKDKTMKLGTFGVRKFKKIVAKKEDIEKLK